MIIGLCVHFILSIVGLILLWLLRDNKYILWYATIYVVYLLIFKRTIILAWTILLGVRKALRSRSYKHFKTLAWNVFHKCTGGTRIELYKSLKSRTKPKILKGIHDIPYKHVIYVCNYPISTITYFTVGLLPDASLITLISKDKRKNKVYNTFLKPIYNEKNQNYIPVIKEESNYEKLVGLIQEHIKRQSICVFPELLNKRHGIYDLAEFRTGIFRIAHALGIPIVPVIFDHIPIDTIGYIKDKPFKVAIGPLVKPSSYKDVTPFVDDIRNWMQLKLSANRK